MSIPRIPPTQRSQSIQGSTERREEYIRRKTQPVTGTGK